MNITITIPTIKTLNEIQPLVDKIKSTVPDNYIVFTSCKKQSAAKNRNACINYAGDGVIIMLDDDIEKFYSGWVEDFLKYWKDDYSIMSMRPLTKQGTDCPILGDNGGGVSTEPDIVKAVHTDETKLNIVGSACMMFKKTRLRFDENFKGGGCYEDTAFCMDHLEAFPDKDIVICNRIRLVHNMEQKGRGTSQGKRDNYEHNRKYFNEKYKIKERFGHWI